jgi:hypothetical protein
MSNRVIGSDGIMKRPVIVVVFDHKQDSRDQIKMTSKYSLLLLLSITGVVLLSTTVSLAHDHHQQPSKPRPSLDLANEVVKAGYWYSQSDFPVANINCDLFTHLFAAFAYVNDITYQVTLISSRL